MKMNYNEFKDEFYTDADAYLIQDIMYKVLMESGNGKLYYDIQKEVTDAREEKTQRNYQEYLKYQDYDEM